MLRILRAVTKMIPLPAAMSKALEDAAVNVGFVETPATGTGASAACTARSEISTSRFDTPAGSIADGDVGDRSTRSMYSDDDAGSSTSAQTTTEDDNTNGDAMGLAGKDPPKATLGQTINAVKSPARVKKILLPKLSLTGTIPAAVPAACSTDLSTSAPPPQLISPAAMARLASIRTKLQHAENLLSARIVIEDE